MFGWINWKRTWPFIWKKLQSLLPNDVLWKVVLKFAQLFKGEDVLISSMYLRYFKLSPLWKGQGSSFEQTWIPFTKRCFVLSLVEIGPLVLQKMILNLSMYFRYFVMISPWKRAGPFIWTNLNPLHPRMLCAKFIHSFKWPLRLNWLIDLFVFHVVSVTFHPYNGGFKIRINQKCHG